MTVLLLIRHVVIIGSIVEKRTIRVVHEYICPIYFKDHSLTQTNSHLEEDFNSIFTLFGKTIQPKASIEYSFIEESSDDSIRFT